MYYRKFQIQLTKKAKRPHVPFSPDEEMPNSRRDSGNFCSVARSSAGKSIFNYKSGKPAFSYDIEAVMVLDAV